MPSNEKFYFFHISTIQTCGGFSMSKPLFCTPSRCNKRAIFSVVAAVSSALLLLGGCYGGGGDGEGGDGPNGGGSKLFCDLSNGACISISLGEVSDCEQAGGTVVNSCGNGGTPTDPCVTNPGSVACCAANSGHSSCGSSDPCVAGPGSAACCAASPGHPSCGSSGTCSGYRLTVNAVPSAGGTMSVTGTHCYGPGTKVEVVLTSIRDGYLFTGWSGALTSRDDTVTVTMNDNQTLIANFELVAKGTVRIADQTYRTITVNGIRWMAENFNYEVDNSWCYNDNPSFCEKYGRLYTWNAASRACPVGWRLPTRQDWIDFVSAVGHNAGTKLKSKEPDWDGTDVIGFSALPGGHRHTDGSFFNVGTYGRWWSATESSATLAWRRDMNSGNGNVLEGSFHKESGYSVRCVQDDAAPR